MTEKRVLIIGGGVAGLTAASDLAGFGIDITVVEKSDFVGGHAIQYACKATDQCVQCGACMAEEKLGRAMGDPRVAVMNGTRVVSVSRANGYVAALRRKPRFIDPEKCTGCGRCLERCPVPGAVRQGFSRHHTPFYAISEQRCLYVKNGGCNVCRDACPEVAIDLDAAETVADLAVDAIVVATGFTPFSPTDKPYGYGALPNVITNLEMERMLRRHGTLLRPSDQGPVQDLAFVQCVGSRDARLGHLWCSQVCCGSALRMAGLVRFQRPDTHIALFYMDVQTFGKDFETFHRRMQHQVRMIRAIPGDIYPAKDHRLRVTYVEGGTSDTVQEDFDLVVLSVGMLPCPGTRNTADLLGVELPETGFAQGPYWPSGNGSQGVFAAGAVNGPMSIPEAVAGAGRAAWQVFRYLTDQTGKV